MRPAYAAGTDAAGVGVGPTDGLGDGVGLGGELGDGLGLGVGLGAVDGSIDDVVDGTTFELPTAADTLGLTTAATLALGEGMASPPRDEVKANAMTSAATRIALATMTGRGRDPARLAPLRRVLRTTGATGTTGPADGSAAVEVPAEVAGDVAAAVPADVAAAATSAGTAGPTGSCVTARTVASAIGAAATGRPDRPLAPRGEPVARTNRGQSTWP